MLSFVEGWSADRCDMLVERFGVDMDWRVNQLSDGRKRRVQLLLAFVRPAAVLLLDEVVSLCFLRDSPKQMISWTLNAPGHDGPRCPRAADIARLPRRGASSHPIRPFCCAG